MADDNAGEWIIAINDDSGSKDRATVALVDAKVDGLKDLIRAEFANIKERIEPLARLSATVVKLEERQDTLDERVTDLERGNERRLEWRRGAMWAGALAVIGAFINLAIAFHWF